MTWHFGNGCNYSYVKLKILKKPEMHRLTFVKCPKCKEVTRQKVIRSERNSKKTIVRTRLCMVCEHRWHTFQTPERIINDRKAGYLRAS